MRLGLVVEGQGEVAALPVLLRRIASWAAPHVSPDIPTPMRVPRSKLVKEFELRRAVEFMAAKVGSEGALLVLLDADDDCPAELGPKLLGWGVRSRPDCRLSVVLARREYETWFLAAARSLRGARTLPQDLEPPGHPEAIRDAKGWLGERMQRGYSATVDQPALTSHFSLVEARVNDSFDKLVRDVCVILGCPIPEAGPAHG